MMRVVESGWERFILSKGNGFTIFQIFMTMMLWVRVFSDLTNGRGVVKVPIVFHSSPLFYLLEADCSTALPRCCVYGKQTCVGSKGIGVALIVTRQHVVFVHEACGCMVRVFSLMWNMILSCLESDIFRDLCLFSSCFGGHETCVLSNRLR